MAPLHDGDPVVVVAAGHRGVHEDLDAGVCPAGHRQLGALGPLGVITPEEVAPQVAVLLDEEDRCTGIGGGQRSPHASGAATGDEDVRVDVPLVVGAVLAGLPVDLATRGELLQDLLVHRPQEGGAHEGLVVEARGQEAPDQLVHGT